MPINTSQIVDAALASAVGYKHLKNQAESNLLAAEDKVITTKLQEAQADKEYKDALGDAAKFQNENPNLSDEDALNQETIERLKKQDDELSKKMFDKHPRNEKGQFISQMEHQQKVSNQLTEVNKDLEMARKARDVIDNKLITKQQLKDAVDVRHKQLEVAQSNVQKADENLTKVQKQTKWLVGGKK